MSPNKTHHGFEMFYDSDGNGPSRFELVTMINTIYGDKSVTHAAKAIGVDSKFLNKCLHQRNHGCPEVIRRAIVRDWKWFNHEALPQIEQAVEKASEKPPEAVF